MLDKEITLFQQESGLYCLASCGKCCTKPDIEACVLEFLPLAYHLYKEHKALEYLHQLETHKNALCVLLQPFLGQDGKGFCGDYKYRGLICRLFGFSGRRNKYGSKELVTCKLIKEGEAKLYEAASEYVNLGNLEIPMMGNYSMMLCAIDFQLASKYYPINEAISLAIETVLAYYSYRSRNLG